MPGADAVGDVRRLHPFVTFGASHLGVIAQTAAYRDGRDWVHQLVAELDANRHLLADLVAEHLPGVRLPLPGGDLPRLARPRRRSASATDPARELLDARARRPLRRTDLRLRRRRGHARLNFATSPDILREAVDRIASSLD